MWRAGFLSKMESRKMTDNEKVLARMNLELLIPQLSHAVERFNGRTTLTPRDIETLTAALAALKS